MATASPSLQAFLESLHTKGVFAICTCPLKTMVFAKDKGSITKCEVGLGGCGKDYTTLEGEYITIFDDYIQKEDANIKEVEKRRKEASKAGAPSGTAVSTISPTVDNVVTKHVMSLKTNPASNWDTYLKDYDESELILLLSDIYNDISVPGCKAKMLDLFRATKPNSAASPHDPEERVKNIKKLIDGVIDPDKL